MSAFGRANERHSFIKPSQSLGGGEAVEFRMTVEVLRRRRAQDGEIGIYLVTRLFFALRHVVAENRYQSGLLVSED